MTAFPSWTNLIRTVELFTLHLKRKGLASFLVLLLNWRGTKILSSDIHTYSEFVQLWNYLLVQDLEVVIILWLLQSSCLLCTRRCIVHNNWKGTLLQAFDAYLMYSEVLCSFSVLVMMLSHIPHFVFDCFCFCICFVFF